MSLYQKLPSFWRSSSDAVETEALYKGCELVVDDIETELNSRIDAALRKTPFLRRQWLPIRLNPSEMTLVTTGVVYGDDRVYADGLIYGTPDTSTWHSYPLPAGVVDAAAVMDAIGAPTYAVWGADFHINGVSSRIAFKSKPSTSPKTLWLYDVRIDDSSPWNQAGWILNYKAPTSASYLAALNAAYRYLTLGATDTLYRELLITAAGLVPPVGDEVVETITSDASYSWVITSKAAYRGHKNATVLVKVGDTIARGASLFDTVNFTASTSGVIIPAAVYGGVADIVVPFQQEQWKYDNGSLRFTVMGSAADIATFWAYVAAKEAAQATSLAARLGITGSTSTQQVNPAALVSALQGANTVYVTVKPLHFLANHFAVVEKVKGSFPAAVKACVDYSLGVATDTIDMTTATEQVAVMSAASPPADMVGVDCLYIDTDPLVSIS